MKKIKDIIFLNNKAVKILVEQVTEASVFKDNDFVAGHTRVLEYLNETNAPIYITDRMGVPTAVHPHYTNRVDANSLPSHLNPDEHVTNGKFIIRYTFTYDISEIDSVRRKFARYGAHSELFRKMSVKCISNTHDKYNRLVNVALRTTIVIDHTLLDDDSVLQLRELGITLSNLRNKGNVRNPQNLSELLRIRQDNIDDGVITDGDPAFYRFRFYTNLEHKYDKIFIRFYDDVQEVPITYDPTGERNGLEVFSKRYVDRDGIPHKSKCRWYTPEEAFDKFELATSIVGAWQLKEEEVKRAKLDKELLEEQLRTKQMQYNYDKLISDKKESDEKYKREIEMLNLKYAKEKAKDKRDSEREDIKYSRDSTTAEFKSFGDMFKIALTTLSNILTSFVQIVKLIPAT